MVLSLAVENSRLTSSALSSLVLSSSFRISAPGQASMMASSVGSLPESSEESSLLSSGSSVRSSSDTS